MQTLLAKLLTFWLKPTFINHRPLDLNLGSDISAGQVRYVLDCDSFADRVLITLGCRLGGLPTPVTIHSDPIAFWCLHHREGFFGRRSPRSSHNLSLMNNLTTDPAKAPLLIPVSIYWGHQPDRKLSAWKALLSDQWGPSSRFRKLLCILLTRSHILVQFGPILAQHQVLDGNVLNKRRAHRLLRAHFKRQRQSIIGPDLSHRRTLIDELLTADSVQVAIDTAAELQELPRHQAAASAYRYAQEIASDQSYRVVRFFNILLTWLWNKLYDGIEVSHLERVRAASEHAEIIYVPCHRSHIDYLLLSYVLYHNGLALPHIAAGINLDLPIVGPLLRRAGAFFMRRSFRDNLLYKAVFDEYLHLLLSRGYSVEYFVEGGRSRNGSMRSPRAGMINMTLKAFYRDHTRDVQFVPVYFSYDRVLEISTYQKELKGHDKQTESLFDLVRVTQLFKLVFGQVNVNFGEPLSLQTYLANQIDGPYNEVATDTHRAICEDLGLNIVKRINATLTVTPIQLFAIIIAQTPEGKISKVDAVEKLRSLQRLAEADYTSCQFQQSDADLIDYVCAASGVSVTSITTGDLIHADQHCRANLKYYEQSVLHLLALPSLIANHLMTLDAARGVDSLERLASTIEPLISILDDSLLYRSDKSPERLAHQVTALRETQLEMTPILDVGSSESSSLINFIAAIIWPILCQIKLTTDLVEAKLSLENIGQALDTAFIEWPSDLFLPTATQDSPQNKTVSLGLDKETLDRMVQSLTKSNPEQGVNAQLRRIQDAVNELLPLPLQASLNPLSRNLIKKHIPTMATTH